VDVPFSVPKRNCGCPLLGSFPDDGDGIAKLTGISHKWRNDAVALNAAASLAGCEASAVSDADVALVFDAAIGWHTPTTCNAAQLDTSARRYGLDEFVADLRRPIE
jgi:hypothetical protein